jgi:competence ComEA-like helix-hairpin-helix protein
VLFASVAATAAVGPGQDPARTEAVADLDDEALAKLGEDAIKKICVECHSFDDMVVLRRTPKAWKDVVAQMATKGAVATEDQFSAIRQYLTRYYGVIPINSAPAADLSAVLGLSAKDANALVEYRQAHGKFADLASILKVPGIAKEKIEADPDALRFD